MSTPYSRQVEQMLADYREQHDALADTQRRLAELSCTATAPRKTITVTAGHGGVIKEVKFPTNAYKRMAPAELASALVDVIAQAQDMVAEEAAAVIAPSLPEGIDAKQMLTGKADLRSLLPEAPRTSDQVRDSFRFDS